MCGRCYANKLGGEVELLGPRGRKGGVDPAGDEGREDCNEMSRLNQCRMCVGK